MEGVKFFLHVQACIIDWSRQWRHFSQLLSWWLWCIWLASVGPALTQSSAPDWQKAPAYILNTVTFPSPVSLTSSLTTVLLSEQVRFTFWISLLTIHQYRLKYKKIISFTSFMHRLCNPHFNNLWHFEVLIVEFEVLCHITCKHISHICCQGVLKWVKSSHKQKRGKDPTNNKTCTFKL